MIIYLLVCRSPNFIQSIAKVDIGESVEELPLLGM